MELPQPNVIVLGRLQWGQKKGDKCRRHHTDKRHSLGSKWFSTAADDSDQTSTA